MYVEVRDKDGVKHIDAVNMALLNLKRKIKKSGLMQELKNREYYMSPSKQRRFKRNEAIKRRKREENKTEWHSRQEE
jgi:ribosomal protein S21